ncbi:YoaK family protein [Bradyrhizobium sp.]|uniref:YoaK family protein n=1 Tax=Bradyrhizobium sp. TaxID=376 RepID=UPI001EC94379|nr:YoaK family protein [Bradyrhizobium sp.]MBV9986009.1 DUF1275 domain-containing protein [Bradyrhizobium sp.]
MRRLQVSPLWMAAALSAVAGMADSAGFILLDGLFIAHVTGNFVLIGAAVARGTAGIVSKILTLPAFFLGVIAARLGDQRLKYQSEAIKLSVLLAAEAVMLLLLVMFGHRLAAGPDEDAIIISALGCTGAFAMGIQNAVGRLHLAQLPASTVMTVNASQFAIDAVDVGLGRIDGDARSKARQRLRNVGIMMSSFACGALAGAIGAMYFRFLILLIPCAILLALTFASAGSPADRP